MAKRRFKTREEQSAYDRKQCIIVLECELRKAESFPGSELLCVEIQKRIDSIRGRRYETRPRWSLHGFPPERLHLGMW